MYVQTNAAEALRFKSRQGSDALVCGSLRTRFVVFAKGACKKCDSKADKTVTCLYVETDECEQWFLNCEFKKSDLLQGKVAQRANPILSVVFVLFLCLRSFSCGFFCL